MSFQQNNNSGIFFNNRKQSDAQPDYKGTATIDGKPYSISGWIKQGKKQPFLSISFTPNFDNSARLEHSQLPEENDLPF